MSAPPPTPQRAQLPRSTWVAVTLLLVLLTLVNIAFMPDVSLELSPTSYGRAPLGFGAVYELLDELGVDVGRSRALYDELPAQAPLWLVQPHGLELPDAPPKGLERLAEPQDPALLDELRTFVEAGGTAVLIGADPEVLRSFELELGEPSPAQGVRARGPLSPASRALAVDDLARFARGDSETLLQVDGEPFAVLRRVGGGHLVAVADARPFSNEHLATADHGALALDLARAFGAPLFDERCHGLASEVTLTGALGMGRVALLCAGLGLMALAWLWHGRSVPAATLTSADGLDPSLAHFVDSLAFLYARSGPKEPAAVYRAYVHGLRHRLRRALYGRGRGSDEQLSQRLARDLAADPELHQAMEGKRVPRSTAELAREVSRIERYMERALWQAKTRSPRVKG